jgi:hypothetical protein
MNPRLLVSRTGCFFLLAALGAGSGLRAEPIRAGFEAGESVSEIDGYPGTTGEGWKGAWKIAPPGTPAQVAVTDGRPLEEASGSYLKMVLEPGSPDLLAAAVFREVAITSLDTTKPYEIRFAMRPDFPTVSDLDMCFAAGSSTAGNPGTGPTCTWMIKTSKSGWVWGNGDGNGAATWVKSGMECRPEQVYHFVVTVDPASSTWKVAVTAGTDRVESDELGFRQADAEGGRHVYFGAALSDAGRKGGFSVDSLSVSTP